MKWLQYLNIRQLGSTLNIKTSTQKDPKSIFRHVVRADSALSHGHAMQMRGIASHFSAGSEARWLAFLGKGTTEMVSTGCPLDAFIMLLQPKCYSLKTSWTPPQKVYNPDSKTNGSWQSDVLSQSLFVENQMRHTQQQKCLAQLRNTALHYPHNAFCTCSRPFNFELVFRLSLKCRTTRNVLLFKGTMLS